MASEAIAPHSSALFLMYSRSASSWPTLPQIAITSRFFSTCSHFRQHEVSRPPEYASYNFFFLSHGCAFLIPPPRRRQFQINVFSVRRLCFDPDWMLRCTKTEPNRCGEATAGNKKPGRGRGVVMRPIVLRQKIRNYLIRTADNTRARRSVFRRLWRRREALVKLKNIAQLLSLVSSLQAMIAGFPATPVRWSVTVRIFEACVNCNPNSQNSRIF